ncbi:aminoacyl-tRNA deacylase [Candidatus Neomarinimicrobiota bacterium]
MPAEKLKSYLDSHNVKYVSCAHSKAFTAQEVAAQAHIPGREMAKIVIVNIDDNPAMVVLPAVEDLDLRLLKEQLNVEHVTLASEREFKDLFPDCEVGAMPPFGNLYGLDVYVSVSLADDEEIAFNAGTHTEVLKLSYKDFERLVRPRIMELSMAW